MLIVGGKGVCKGQEGELEEGCKSYQASKSKGGRGSHGGGGGGVGCKWKRLEKSHDVPRLKE